MKKIFTAVTSFFRRLKIAWIASRDTDLLEAIESCKMLAKQKQEHIEFLLQLDQGMPHLANMLLPIVKRSEAGILKIEFRSKRLITSAEADEVLAQSKVRYQIPSSYSKAARKRLAKHEGKFRKKQRKSI